MAYQGAPQRNNKRKIRSYIGVRPDIGPQEFRSSWEANFARLMNYLDIEWSYEPHRFFLSNSISYLPDFELKSPNPWNTKWIEIKGLWNRGDKAKLRYFMSKYPEEKIKVIARKEYAKLIKQYSKIIPNWEGYSGRKKKDK